MKKNQGFASRTTLQKKAEKHWENLTPKVAVEYRFSKDAMTYVSAAKGYHSGGFNWAATRQYYRMAYDPQTLHSFEAGTKCSFLDGKIETSTAVFLIKIKDMPVTQGFSPLVNYTDNAAKAISKGFEFETVLKPLEGVSISAGFGYTDIRFDKFHDVLGDYAGNRAPFAPAYTYNMSCQYRHQTGFYTRTDL